MNKAGSRIYIYIFTLLFIGEDSSSLSEISSVFGCGGVGCGTTTEESSEDEVEPIKIPKRRKVVEDSDDEADSPGFTSGQGRSRRVWRGRGTRGGHSSEQGRGKRGRGGSAGTSTENRGMRGGRSSEQGRGKRGRGGSAGTSTENRGRRGRRRPAQGHKSTQEDRYLEVVYILYIHIP